MNVKLIVALILVNSLLVFGYNSTPSFEFQVSNSYTLHWKIDLTRKLITVSAIIEDRAWVGFGISGDSGMKNADIIVAHFEDGWDVDDRWSFKEGKPSNDVALGGKDNLLEFNVDQSEVTNMTFVRALDTGDKFDQVITNTTMNIIWAYGQNHDNSFSYHGSNRGQVEINLFTGQVAPPPLSQINLPTGFDISLFAKVPNARTMALTDDGILYIGSRQGGSIHSLDTKAPDTVYTVISGLEEPNGVEYYKGDLYVAEIRAIKRYPNLGSLKNISYLPQPQIIHTFDLPPSEQHAWKVLHIGPDGMLYVSINSPCNTCLYNETYGTMLRMSRFGGSVTTLFRGIRDTQGFDWHPTTNQMWWTDNGRDLWGNLRPPDEVNMYDASMQLPHYGFPYCYGKNTSDPSYNKAGSCDAFVPDKYSLPAHDGALGVLFYTGSMFPSSYKNLLFICEHGSWNREPPFGYRLTTLDVSTGSPNLFDYKIFADGWLQGSSASGRPVALLQMPDGSLLMSDDSRGYIYRISYSNNN